MERRIYPFDRRAYTLKELQDHFDGEYAEHEVEEYWDKYCRSSASSRGVQRPPATSSVYDERRLNPASGRTHTLAEFMAPLRSRYGEQAVWRYWTRVCKPVPPPSGCSLARAGHSADTNGCTTASDECARCQPESEQMRVNPEDDGVYTLPMLLKRYARQYTPQRICQYWEEECWPIGSTDGHPAEHDRREAQSVPTHAAAAAPVVCAHAALTTLEEAERLKEAGNKLFKDHRFDDARLEYSRAMSALPSSGGRDSAAVCSLRAKILNNRAACAQQLHDWDAVIQDTTAVAEVDPGNLKAALRRAIAFEALEQFDRAFEDACTVLAAEPGHPLANGVRNRTRDLREEAAQARERRGRRDLEAKSAASIQESLADFRFDDLAVLSRGFPWGATDFLGGLEANNAVLQGFEEELKARACTGPPFWWGLDDAMEEDAECLRMALDILVAYLKNYQLDRCDAVARSVLPAARKRGLPWNVKALQDCATLRMKQARQAEAAALLEEINEYVPPNPIHCKNLGTAYNQLRQHERAIECFQTAVRLQDGWMNPSDRWDIGIAKKHMRKFDEALPLLIDALEGFKADGADDVTLAKLHDNLGSCYVEMGKAYGREAQYAAWAEPHFREAEGLFRGAIGVESPLYGGAALQVGRSLVLQGRCSEAETWLQEALRVETEKDAVHPTPLHDLVEELLDLAARGGLRDPRSYHGALHHGIERLQQRGLCGDGNGGMVMHKVARFLMLSGAEYRPAALTYLQAALALIRNHRDPPVDTSMHCLVLEMEINICQQLLNGQMLAILDIER